MATIIYYTTRSNSKRPKRPFSSPGITRITKNHFSFFSRQRELLQRADKGIRGSVKVSLFILSIRCGFSSFFLPYSLMDAHDFPSAYRRHSERPGSCRLTGRPSRGVVASSGQWLSPWAICHPIYHIFWWKCQGALPDPCFRLAQGLWTVIWWWRIGRLRCDQSNCLIDSRALSVRDHVAVWVKGRKGKITVELILIASKCSQLAFLWRKEVGLRATDGWVQHPIINWCINSNMLHIHYHDHMHVRSYFINNTPTTVWMMLCHVHMVFFLAPFQPL